MRKGFLPVLLILGLAAGCSSFQTTAIDRLENDTIVVNPEKPLKGVPVSLRVPTHLELSVIETTYWKIGVDATPDQNPTVVPLAACRPTRTVTHDAKYTEKIFLVDPVRPGSGTGSYGFAFTSNDADKRDQGKGHLRNVTYKIDDTTIRDSASLLATSLNFVNALATSSNVPLANNSSLIATDRVVAFARFDINSPTFECDVACFLESNLNTVPCENACRAQVCPAKTQ